ncbi:MAG: heme exporter protein CcmB [Phycisphaerae bacterium]|jgi:heme exporter protein B|nr:heme exporter protein CcmB [Phycisphaerae bacterium]
MMRVLKQIVLLTAKDLRIEARSRQTLGLVIMLGILIIVVLGLGLNAQVKARAFSPTAILWVAYLFGGVLCFEKTMAVERHDGALAGLLAAPVDRGVIFAGKLLSNLALMFMLACVVTPVAIVLFNFDLSTAPGGFIIVTALSMIGFAAVGTLFSAATSSSRLQGGLLAILVFPICLPLVITSTKMLMDMFTDGRPLSAEGLGILFAFDGVYLVISWLAFERILEP